MYCLLTEIEGSVPIVFFVSDQAGPDQQFLGLPVLKTEDVLHEYKEKTVKPQVLIAIGDIAANCRMEKLFTAGGYSFFNAIHLSVNTRWFKHLGKGVSITAGCIFTVNAVVDDFSIVNIGCTISHDVIIGKHVNICPGVHIAGKVIIEDEVFIGTGATIIPGVHIGKGSVIAAGAAVTRNVEPGDMVAGVPAISRKNRTG